MIVFWWKHRIKFCGKLERIRLRVCVFTNFELARVKCGKQQSIVKLCEAEDCLFLSLSVFTKEDRKYEQVSPGITGNSNTQ